MRPVILALLAALALLLPLSPAQADPIAQDSEHCVINVRSDDVLNLRAGPSARSDILAGMRYSQCGVMVTGECRGDWCPLEDGHYAGWAHRRYLGMVSPAMYCVTGLAQDDGLNLRAWPSTTSRVLTVLAPNACGIAILPFARDGWQKIRAEAWEGWVRRSYLTGQ